MTFGGRGLCSCECREEYFPPTVGHVAFAAKRQHCSLQSPAMETMVTILSSLSEHGQARPGPDRPERARAGPNGPGWPRAYSGPDRRARIDGPGSTGPDRRARIDGPGSTSPARVDGPGSTGHGSTAGSTGAARIDGPRSTGPDRSAQIDGPGSTGPDRRARIGGPGLARTGPDQPWAWTDPG